ncbi:MAG: hypothetical protein KBG77_15330 [Dermatophilaceae bacterium]|nr:hypothetical protein [Dermatophilaceae bacterium]
MPCPPVCRALPYAARGRRLAGWRWFGWSQTDRCGGFGSTQGSPGRRRPGQGAILYAVCPGERPAQEVDDSHPGERTADGPTELVVRVPTSK